MITYRLFYSGNQTSTRNKTTFLSSCWSDRINPIDITDFHKSFTLLFFAEGKWLQAQRIFTARQNSHRVMFSVACRIYPFTAAIRARLSCLFASRFFFVFFFVSCNNELTAAGLRSEYTTRDSDLSNYTLLLFFCARVLSDKMPG